MKRDTDSRAPQDVARKGAPSPTDRSLEAAAEFERAIAAAERDGPSAGVHPRVHEAMIEAMRSELEVLREQLRPTRSSPSAS
jgi:hypothetical protein